MSDATWTPIQQINTPHLQKNLAYLQVKAPDVLGLIQTGAGGEPLLLQNQGGKVLCKIGGADGRWIFGGTDPALELAEIRARIDAIQPETRLVALMGNAVGYALAHLIKRLLDTPDLRAMVFEPSATRVYACLCMIDLRAALATGRLHFACGEMSLSSTMEALRRRNLLQGDPAQVVFAPETDVDWDEAAFLSAYREASGQAMKRRRSVLETLEKRKAEAGAEVIERVLLIDCWPGAPGEIHLKAIQKALRQRGIQTEWLAFNRYQIEEQGEEYRRAVEPKLASVLETFAPQLAVSYGYHGRQLAAREWFEASGAKWLQMVSNICYYDTDYYPSECSGLIEPNLIPLFQKRGAARPFFVPIMADYCLDRPAQTNRQIPVVFVGNSLAMAPAEKQALHQEWRERLALLDYLRDASDLLGRFDSGADLYSHQTENPPPQTDGLYDEFRVFRYLLCEASSRKRKRVLERLAPMGLALFGGDWENTLEPDSVLRPCLRGYLGIHDEPKIFSHGAVFVNVQSSGHVAGPNMRFFNVAGMGGFQVSDNPRLGEFLESDKETVYFASEEECAERVKHCLAHPNEMDEIRNAAQERVRRDWTYDRWIDWIANEMKIVFQ